MKSGKAVGFAKIAEEAFNKVRWKTHKRGIKVTVRIALEERLEKTLFYAYLHMKYREVGSAHSTEETQEGLRSSYGG